VGRLQHDGHWPHSHGNQLKRQLTFAATPDDSLPDAAERADLTKALEADPESIFMIINRIRGLVF